MKSSDTEEDKLSKNQKDKMSVYSNLLREKTPLYKRYSEKLWKTCYDNMLTTLATDSVIIKYKEHIKLM